MNRLIIDVGTTRLKWGLWRPLGALSLEGEWEDFGHCPVDDLVALPRTDHAVLGCHDLHPQRQKILTALAGMAIHEVRTSASALGLRNSYQPPESLGIDRFAAMIEAQHLFPHQSLLVIDAGTALTLDPITADGHFAGGLILPGVVRLRTSLTQGLPHLQHLEAAVEKIISTPFPPSERAVAAIALGNTTETAMALGCVTMLVATIRDIEKRYSAKLVLTGGDAHLIARHLSDPVPIFPHLVLDGLRRLAQANV